MFRLIAVMIIALGVATPTVPAAVAAPSAPDQLFGQWHAVTDATSVFAYTENDSGAQFGYACINGTCSYYLYTRAGCVADNEYDLLLSSQTAGNAPQIHAAFPRAFCGKDKDDSADPPALYFDGQNMPALIAASVVAIAMPVEDTQFRVSKFSLDGANAAVAWVQATVGHAPASGIAPR